MLYRRNQKKNKASSGCPGEKKRRKRPCRRSALPARASELSEGIGEGRRPNFGGRREVRRYVRKVKEPRRDVGRPEKRTAGSTCMLNSSVLSRRRARGYTLLAHMRKKKEYQGDNDPLTTKGMKVHQGLLSQAWNRSGKSPRPCEGIGEAGNTDESRRNDWKVGTIHRV